MAKFFFLKNKKDEKTYAKNETFWNCNTTKIWQKQIYKHPKFNTNAIGNKEICFNRQETLFKKNRSILQQYCKQTKKLNVALFTDSILKLLLINKIYKVLNRGIAHHKPFSGSKVKQMDHHTIPILEEHQSDAAAIRVRINGFIKCRTSFNVNKNAKDFINIALRCQSHNLARIFISSVGYSTKVSYTIIQKLNEHLLNECAKYIFHLIYNRAVSKKDLLNDGVHLLESGKVIIIYNLINGINNFLVVANSVLRSC